MDEQAIRKPGTGRDAETVRPTPARLAAYQHSPIAVSRATFPEIMVTFLHKETNGLLCVVGIRKKANMTTPTTTPEYMLLFRGMDWDRGLSPEEIQNVMSRWIAWFDRLTEQGKARAGQPLTDKGKVISGKKGQTVLDGPFAESKETVAGYILLQVDSLDEAVEIAKECPGLDYGISVEVRLVDHLRASLFSINMVRK